MSDLVSDTAPGATPSARPRSTAIRSTSSWRRPRRPLLVVGGRGVGGLAGLLLGSTATAWSRTPHCPVVVLPDDTAVQARDRHVRRRGGRGPGRTTRPSPSRSPRPPPAAPTSSRCTPGRTSSSRPRSSRPALLVDWAGVQADEERVLAEALAGWPEKDPDVVVREVVIREKTARALVGRPHRPAAGRRPLPAPDAGITTHGALHRAGCPVAVVPITARAAPMTAAAPRVLVSWPAGTVPPRRSGRRWPGSIGRPAAAAVRGPLPVDHHPDPARLRRGGPGQRGVRRRLAGAGPRVRDHARGRPAHTPALALLQRPHRRTAVPARRALRRGRPDPDLTGRAGPPDLPRQAGQERLSFGERAMVTAMRAPVGDFRDWDAVRRLGEEIADADRRRRRADARSVRDRPGRSRPPGDGAEPASAAQGSRGARRGGVPASPGDGDRRADQLHRRRPARHRPGAVRAARGPGAHPRGARQRRWWRPSAAPSSPSGSTPSTPRTETGWSVTVVGPSRVLGDPDAVGVAPGVGLPGHWTGPGRCLIAVQVGPAPRAGRRGHLNRGVLHRSPHLPPAEADVRTLGSSQEVTGGDLRGARTGAGPAVIRRPPLSGHAADRAARRGAGAAGRRRPHAGPGAAPARRLPERVDRPRPGQPRCAGSSRRRTELVDARYGALGVLREDGRAGAFIHVGIDDELRRPHGHLPEGKGVLGQLITEPYPLRIHDLGQHPVVRRASRPTTRRCTASSASPCSCAARSSATCT